MNKKILMTATAVTLGMVMLVTTAFASSKTSAGYEAFKTSTKNMHDIDSWISFLYMKGAHKDEQS